MVTDDLVSKGFDAGNIIKIIAPIVGGRGGGEKNNGSSWRIKNR